MTSLSAHELHAYINEHQTRDDILYVDVRTSSEFRREHIHPFKNIPLDTIEHRLNEIKPFNTLVLSCLTGNRSSQAYMQLKNDSPNIIELKGGLMAWKEANLPIEKGNSNSISIMRQVHIIVGIATLTASLLAHFYSIHFIWVSAFFGAGLLFSGLTNTFALAIILTKLPWNK